MRDTGPFEVLPFRPERNATIDTLRWAKKRLLIPTLLEVDVTAGRQAIRAFRSETGKGLSFTAWVIHCVARAAAEHPRVHALRRGRRHLVVFQEVDVAVVVERAIAGAPSGETLPMPFVIRKANEKSAADIHEEIGRARASNVESGAVSLDPSSRRFMQSLFLRLPGRLRDLLFWRWLLRSPALVKRTMGTVVVTAVGMAAPGVLAWGVPLSLHPLTVCIGGIAERSTAAGSSQVLALTILFDHAVVDGVPVGRFIRRLNQLMSQADGLSIDRRSAI